MMKKFKTTKRTPVTIILEKAYNTLGLKVGGIYSDIRTSPAKYAPIRRYKVASPVSTKSKALKIAVIANQEFAAHNIAAEAKVWMGDERSCYNRHYPMVIVNLYK